MSVPIFLLQVAVILAVCRLVGTLAKYLGQPRVVGEMVAGVLLGPSLLGMIAPSVSEYVFPRAGMHTLELVSRLGLTLYMFSVGLEFRLDIAAKRARPALSISLAGTVAPFILGGLLALYLHDRPGYFTELMSRPASMLYLGAAMAITAFPMLARIVQEYNLGHTTVGTLSLAAGALGDAAAWCILALVMAIIGAGWSTFLFTVGGALGVVLIAVLVMRPALRWLYSRALPADSHLQLVLVLLLLTAWFTERTGIHAVFGAFLVGAVVPRDGPADALARLTGPIATALLVPLFFAYSGLNTRIDLLDSPQLWLVTGVVVAAACAGKGLACWAAARAHGIPMRESAAIGALMNSRGLMELIILNIGLERGLITPTLFSIFILMAVVTTVMATPLMQLALGGKNLRAGTETG